MPKFFKLSGTALEVDVDSFARQADGSAWLKCGNNIILATVVGGKSESNNMGFFPLTVEYRTRPAAVGKFPGGYIKREGKLSDQEVLLSRLVDRSIRPLFPKHYQGEVQMMLSLLSYDGSFPLEVLGVLSASIALQVSGLPIGNALSAVVMTRESGQKEWVVNPDMNKVSESADHVLIVGTSDAVCMLEATCDFVTEDELLGLLDDAMVHIRQHTKWQKDILAEHPAKVFAYKGKTDEFFKEWGQKVKAAFPANWHDFVFDADKQSLSAKHSELKHLVQEQFKANVEAKELSAYELDVIYEVQLKSMMPNVIFERKQRFDMRGFEQIRNISCQVDLLPCSHGSAVFTRGQTQALGSLTLGTKLDAQRNETLLHGVQDRIFSLHYNFPPYCTGEAKPLRAVGRREIGHGYLAEKAFKFVLPEPSKFPYTIRSLIDVLESNGSSSMAAVCATTLCLMDGGVPLKEGVAGIAMGMLKDQSGHFVVLSDITGTEDAYGVMDLKVVGNRRGISALQMDVKLDHGVPMEAMRQALDAAKKGRIAILTEMESALDKPRAELKDTAPQVFSINIPPSKIGAVIGPSGKNIKEITAATETQIDITDDGVVTIFARDKLLARKAESWIRALIGEIKVGSSYVGRISKIMPELGIFVTLVPGKDGLIHNSSIDRNKRNLLGKQYKEGDELSVIVLANDQERGRIKLTAPALEASEEFGE